MKRRLRAYKKTVSIVNEKAIELYKGLGIEKKGFLLEGTDKESGQYTFMGVEPNEGDYDEGVVKYHIRQGLENVLKEQPNRKIEIEEIFKKYNL